MHFQMLNVKCRTENARAPELKLWRANVGTCMNLGGLKKCVTHEFLKFIFSKMKLTNMFHKQI